MSGGRRGSMWAAMVCVVGLVPAACSPAPEPPAATPGTTRAGIGFPAGDDVSGCTPDPARAERPLRIWHTIERTQADRLQVMIEARVRTPFELQRFESVDTLRAALADVTVPQPDLVLAADEVFAELVDSGRFWPAQPCLERGGVHLPELLRVVARTWTIEGTLWAVPVAMSTLITYVKTARVADLGLGPPDAPASILDAVAVPAPSGWAARWVADRDLCRLVNEQWPAQRGAPIVEWDKASGTFTTHLDDPAYRSDLDHLRDAGRQGLSITSRDALVQKAVGGDTPFVLGPAWGLLFGKILIDTGQLDPDTVMAAPAPAVGTGVMAFGFGGLVPKQRGGIHPTVRDLLATLASPDFQAELGASTGFVPSTPAALQSATLKAGWATHPQLEVAYRSLEATPDDERFAGIKSPLGSELRTVLDSVCLGAVFGNDIDELTRRADITLHELDEAWRSASRPS